MIEAEKLNTRYFDIYRIKVPGGWLVTVKTTYSEAPSVTFYPDPQHKWDGNSLP